MSTTVFVLFASFPCIQIGLKMLNVMILLYNLSYIYTNVYSLLISYSNFRFYSFRSQYVFLYCQKQFDVTRSLPDLNSFEVLRLRETLLKTKQISRFVSVANFNRSGLITLVESLCNTLCINRTEKMAAWISIKSRQ